MFRRGSLLKVQEGKKPTHDDLECAGRYIFCCQSGVRFLLLITGETNERTIVGKTEASIPIDFSLILGDAIHNLKICP